MKNSEKLFETYLQEAQRNYERKVSFKKSVDYGNARKKYSVDEKIILYTSYHGRGLCCNPYAIFCYLKSNVRFQDYTHVWVLDHMENHELEIEEYKNEDHVIFVELNSEEYMKYLSCAKYLITNVTEIDYYTKKPDQIVINTWHGTPLKTLGYDIPEGAATIGNTERNFLMDDYILSPNKYSTQVFRNSYKLDHIYEGKILETGYPRCDLLFHTDKETFVRKAKYYGVDIDPNKKLILYAPTWRGTKGSNPDIDVSKDLGFIEKLYSYVDPEKYQILFKPHQFVYKALQDRGMLEANCVPSTIDANEILSVTDILISDYSSIFFDYLVTGKPILFYIPDLIEYQKERGLYFPISELPGPTTDHVEKVGEWLQEIDENPKAYVQLFEYNNYLKSQKKFVPYEDGHVCERFCSAVFEKKEMAANPISFHTDKIKVLIHLDILLSNGITTSALNLMNYLDYEKYDVTLFAIPSPKAPQVWDKINPNVRVLKKVGVIPQTLEEFAEKEYCLDQAIIEGDGNVLFPKEYYETMYKHHFGDVVFDYIVNYSGYSGFWANMYRTNAHAKYFIWMHNDMKAEIQKIVNGKQVHGKSLPTMFKHYKYADKIVGCSKSTMEINRENLATSETYKKFTWVHNMLDSKKIYENVDNGTIIKSAGKKWILQENTDEKNVQSCIPTQLIPYPEEDTINFVTIGRLSPEKNHKNLMNAFARLQKEKPNLRLYIMGDGALNRELREQIEQLHLENKVFLTGNVSNPFFIEKHCDCFILPSLHEGMPMVLLEARTLKLPIIVSDFSTVKDSLWENGQLLIHKDEDSIYQGMKSFLDGKVPNQFEFDPEVYNKNCLKEFEALF